MYTRLRLSPGIDQMIWHKIVCSQMTAVTWREGLWLELCWLLIKCAIFSFSHLPTKRLFVVNLAIKPKMRYRTGGAPPEPPVSVYVDGEFNVIFRISIGSFRWSSKTTWLFSKCYRIHRIRGVFSRKTLYRSTTNILLKGELNLDKKWQSDYLFYIIMNDIHPRFNQFCVILKLS